MPADFAVEQLPWARRAMAMPSMPGGLELQKARLLDVLRAAAGLGFADGCPDVAALLDLQQRLGPLGLTERHAGGVQLTARGKALLDDPSDAAIFRLLHATVVFVGEMLQRTAGDGAKVEDLRAAADEYRLGWTTPDQIRRRLNWLHALGLVEDGPNRLHRMTADGRRELAAVQVVRPEDVLNTQFAAVNEIDDAPPLLAAELSTIAHGRRSASIGYLPRDPVGSLALLVDLAQQPVGRDDLVSAIAERLTLNTSSARSFTDTARVLGLHEYTGRDIVCATPLGIEFREHASELNLVRLMHSRYVPFAEVLGFVSEVNPASAGEIQAGLPEAFAAAKRPQRTSTVLRRLTAAGALAEVGWARYIITPLGTSLAKTLPMEAPPQAEEAEVLERRTDDADPQTLRAELLGASRDAGNPTRFERAVAAAFMELDVEAEHLGGAGRTDVSVTIRSGLRVLDTVIVDAKTAASGTLREDSVNFDTLREHAVQHDDARIVVVAPGFDGAGRLKARAVTNSVRLLTAEELADLVLEHLRQPFSPAELLGVLTEGRVDETRVARQEAADSLATAARVLHELVTEDRRPDAEPISARDVQRAMRDERNTPIAAVTAALDLLSGPWVGALNEAESGRFVLAAPVRVAARRLRALADALEAADRP